MTTFMLPCGKANAPGSLRTALITLPRLYSTANGKDQDSGNGNSKHRTKSEDAALQRDLFVNVLNANATKRDAKQYLSRFKCVELNTSSAESQAELNARHRGPDHPLNRAGVNLGSLYAQGPQFTQHPLDHGRVQIDRSKFQVPRKSPLHLALVCLKNPESVDDTTLEGLAVTLSQLVKLDMQIILVLDSDAHPATSQRAKPDATAARDMLAHQAVRIRNFLELHNTNGGRYIPDVLEQTDEGEHPPTENAKRLKLALPELLQAPLRRGIVPIIPCLAYSDTGRLLRETCTNVMTALIKGLVKDDLPGSSDTNKSSDHQTSLDRIIVLDSSGGIPSKDRRGGAHVFINLMQEFDDIERELLDYGAAASDNTIGSGDSTTYEAHGRNLDMVQKCLELLPHASSALIITPHEAATSAHANRPDGSTLGAGTRPIKNLLIHNLLTNKPMVSSSLPTARLSGPSGDDHRPASTLVKRGMPVKFVPAAERPFGWQLPKDGVSSVKIHDDAHIDFPKLLHLIQDSFRRKLDVSHYLARIEGRTAGIIVAGDYEGAAILTWEMPPGTNDPARLVPYLDKFAVLQSSQGSSGVADIVFQAMVRTCFPRGVCWRSRKDNPVNKWYFERAVGHWKLPGTNWTMFWTGEDVVDDEQRFNDYVAVCSSVQPSWADGKKPD